MMREIIFPDVIAENNFQEFFLLVGGGRSPSVEWLRKIGAEKKIFCADRGAEYVLNANLRPYALYGDCDSCNGKIYEQACSMGARVEIFSPMKDDTDLQLVLKNIPDGDLLATGVFGGRLDHLYSNIFSLLNFKKEKNNLTVLADDWEMLFLLTDGEKIKIKFAASKKPVALSLLPLSEKCRVNFTGVKWSLNEAELKQLHPYSVSNILERESTACECECLAGDVGLYITWN